MEKNDIQDRKDIVRLIDHFYTLIRQDKSIGDLYQNTYQVQWEKYLPIMYDFWENVLFYSGGYNGNPMYVHQKLHHMHAIKKADFKRWLELFKQAVDELYQGPMAEEIKLRASNIATIMQLKLFK